MPDKIIESNLEISEEAKKDIDKSIEEYKRGKFFSLEEVKQELGF